MDFHELIQVLMMGKQFGDPKFHWGKTRARTMKSILTSGRVGSQDWVSIKRQVSTECGTHFHPHSDFQPFEH